MGLGHIHLHRLWALGEVRGLQAPPLFAESLYLSPPAWLVPAPHLQGAPTERGVISEPPEAHGHASPGAGASGGVAGDGWWAVCLYLSLPRQPLPGLQHLIYSQFEGLVKSFLDLAPFISPF